MKKYIVTIFILSVLSSINSNTMYAQDPSSSQPYANPLYLNPAFAGTGNSQILGFNYRNQWPNGTEYVTANISYDRSIIDSINGIGLLANIDKVGPDPNALITDNVSLIYAHQFHIKTFTLSLGAQGTYLHEYLNSPDLNYGITVNPGRGFIYTTSEQLSRTSVSTPDFSAGVLGYGKYYFLGFSMDHLTQPNESFVPGNSPLPEKYVFNGGFILPIGSFTISPAILYEQQGYSRQTLLECYFTKGRFTIGIGERTQDALIYMFGYQSRFFRVGLSYDYTISNLTNAETGGSYELSIAVLLHYKSAKLKKISGINCPAY